MIDDVTTWFLKKGPITLALHRVKGFTWLVVEETTNASLRSVKEGCCHGVIFPICTEQLGQTENKTGITRQRHVSAPDVWFRDRLYKQSRKKVSRRLVSFNS